MHTHIAQDKQEWGYARAQEEKQLQHQQNGPGVVQPGYGKGHPAQQDRCPPQGQSNPYSPAGGRLELSALCMPGRAVMRVTVQLTMMVMDMVMVMMKTLIMMIMIMTFPI
jgi:hypothetical protein